MSDILDTGENNTEAGQTGNQTSGTESQAPGTESQAPKVKTPETEEGILEMKEESQETGAPESYTDFTYPDNFQPNEEVVNIFKEEFKKNNLSQEQAQGVITALSGIAEKEAEKYVLQDKTWKEELKTDPEFGGANYQANVDMARKALNAFGSPELQRILSSAGFINNPVVVKTFAAIGKAMGEDTYHSGSPPRINKAKTRAQEIFPNHK